MDGGDSLAFDLVTKLRLLDEKVGEKKNSFYHLSLDEEEFQIELEQDSTLSLVWTKTVLCHQ